jgi:hypothetical protein
MGSTEAKTVADFAIPQRQDSCRSLTQLISGARRQRSGDKAVFSDL